MAFPITLDEIAEAYEATGMKPTVKTWYTVVNGQPCACPMGVVFIHRFGIRALALVIQQAARRGSGAHAEILKRLGVSNSQAYGFVVGYDAAKGESIADLDAFDFGREARTRFQPVEHA